MDRMYFITTIDNLEREKAVHATKFADNPAHANCIPNFDLALGKLRAELEKIESAANRAH